MLEHFSTGRKVPRTPLPDSLRPRMPGYVNVSPENDFIFGRRQPLDEVYGNGFIADAEFDEDDEDDDDE